MSDLIGKKLRDFYVLRRLGRGAMAEVYLARQLSLGRQVALKVLDAELARDPNYVRRFHHEARAAAALVHGGIVQIYEVGEESGVHYIAQEYVEGRNLGELIRGQGTLPVPLALDILCQVAAALAKAASQGIVHRDIKPENIMLSRTGEVKVADFGLARVQGDHAAGGTNLTQIGVTMGTPLYMSPEQIEGRALDARSDIYSLGVTAYHMLAGEPPFGGDTALAVAVRHLNEPPVALATRRPDMPPRVNQLVARMMAKKPDDRFPDPASLLHELHSLGAELTGQFDVPSRTSGSGLLKEMLRAADQRAAATTRLDELMKTSAVRRQGRSSRRWLAAAALACLLLGGVLAAMTRPTPLLAGAEAGPPRRTSVWEQLYHAKLVDTEEAWLAVGRHFPDAGDYYHHLAAQGLAYYYLTRAGDYRRALRPLEELAELGSAQPVFHAFGVAGLVVVHAGLGDGRLAYQANERLTTEMRARLEAQAPRMATMLEEALAELANRKR